MTKPDDIPQDVWEKASQVVGLQSGCHCDHCCQMRGLVEPIARAIMTAKAEEREACSNLLLAAAEKKQALRLALGEMTSQEMRTLIAGIGFLAAAIRKRGEAD